MSGTTAISLPGVTPSPIIRLQGGKTFDLASRDAPPAQKVFIPPQAFFSLACSGHIIGLNLLGASSDINVTMAALSDFKARMLAGNKLKEQNDAVIAFLTGLSNEKDKTHSTVAGHTQTSEFLGVSLAALHLQGKIQILSDNSIVMGPKGDEALMQDIRSVVAILSGRYTGRDKINALEFFHRLGDDVIGDLNPNTLSAELNNASDANRRVLEDFKSILQQFVSALR